MESRALKAKACGAVDSMRSELLRLSHAIHAQPELSFQISGMLPPLEPIVDITSPFGRAMVVGYQRPRFMGWTVLQLSVVKSNVLAVLT